MAKDKKALKLPDIKALSKLFPKKTAAPASKTKVFFAPEKDMGRVSYIFGLVCRAVVIFLSIFGLIYMLYESVGIYLKTADFRTYSIPLYAMVLICAVCALVCSFTSYNKITKIAVPIAGAVGIAVWLAAFSGGNIFLLAENSVRRLYNDFLYGASLRGYTSFAGAMFKDSYSYSKETLYLTMTLLLAAALSVIMYFAVSRKARLWLFSLISVAYILPLLILNLPRSNAGFAMAVSSIVGFLALWTSDRRCGGLYERQSARRERRLEKSESRKTKKYEKRLENLKVKEAAERIYETALEAGMGKSGADKAKRSVYKRVIIEEYEEKKRLRDKAKAEKRREKLLRKEKKKEKNAYKKLPAAERAEAEKQIKAEKKLTKAALKKERREKRKKKRKERAVRRTAAAKNRAAGGYSGAIAAAVALLALWLPSVLSSKPFPTIDFIERKVEAIRAYTDDVLMGDDVDLSSGDLYSSYEKFGFETLNFDPREYDGTTIFILDSDRQDTVYLKSRTATSFDANSDTWSFPSSEDVVSFRELFGEDFSSDEITTGAYKWLYPTSTAIPRKGSYLNFSRYGFTVQQIHAMRVNGKSRLMFTPSFMNTDIGVLKRGKTEEARGDYTAYFDGIYTSRYFGGKTDGYSTVSYIYNLKRNDISDVFTAEENILNLTAELAEREKQGDKAENLAMLYGLYASQFSVSSDLGERYFTSMTDEEKEEFLDFIETEKEYRAYVQKTYTRSPGDLSIRALAQTIQYDAKSEKSGALSRHETVMAVINYLCSDDFSYSLTPKEGSGEYDTALETFLFETKEGYCSHYATAAAVLLRELGVPVRFTEGYIANDWTVAPGTIWVSRYGCTVLDSDAHTWIEVYYDGIGWIPYEATKTFAEEMYATEDDSQGSSDSSATGEEDSENSNTAETDDTNGSQNNTTPPPAVIPPIGGGGEGVDAAAVLRQFRTLIIVVVSALTAYFIALAVIKAVKRGAEKATKKRYELVEKARNEEVFRDKATDTRSIARRLDDCIFEIFKAVGIGPEKGELLEEFGKRLEKEYRDLSTLDPVYIMNCVQKEEFGHGLRFTELSDLAEYLSDIMVTVYTGLTPMQKFKLRYIRHII